MFNYKNSYNRIIIKSCLPISIVESEGFRELIEFWEPSCNVLSRYRVKHSGLTEIKSMVENKIIKELKMFDSVNIRSYVA